MSHKSRYSDWFPMCVAACMGLLFSGSSQALTAAELLRSELLFPLEHWHNHGSCIVECPNGDLMVCWFHGSGERKSDDVEILGARFEQASQAWTKPFPMADTPGFPDTNCCMIVDPEERLWLLWPTIQANLWESALMKIKRSSDYMRPGQAPVWDVMDVMHVKHEGDFAATVDRKLTDYASTLSLDAPGLAEHANAWMDHVKAQAADKLTRRLGWFTRAHPLLLDDGRMLVGLYSDGFSFSLVGITDDLGKTWRYSEPIVGGGNIQPSFAQKADGTLVAYMRDNGPAPHRVMVSESTDRGETWSRVTDHPQLANPGSGLELMRLADGDWLCISNDLEDGRYSLAVSLSRDEGATWPITRHLEFDPSHEGSFHYPSVIQARDGSLHATYSYFVSAPDGEGKSIKHVHFTKEWVEDGDPAGPPRP
jgi:predicted neuraminidase